MNLQEALETSNWLLDRISLYELTPEEALRVKEMRDVLYYLHAAAGITEIRVQSREGDGEGKVADH